MIHSLRAALGCTAAHIAAFTLHTFNEVRLEDFKVLMPSFWEENEDDTTITAKNMGHLPLVPSQYCEMAVRQSSRNPTWRVGPVFDPEGSSYARSYTASDEENDSLANTTSLRGMLR